MSKLILYAKWFHSEPAAYRWVEARVWPDGPVCPHCGGASSISKMNGRSTRIGAYKCYQCRQPFTVKIGTILEGSHLPLNLWLQAIYLLRPPKIGSVQLVRTLGIAPKPPSTSLVGCVWQIGRTGPQTLKQSPTAAAGMVSARDSLRQRGNTALTAQ
jgi:transposase-like protein